MLRQLGERLAAPDGANLWGIVVDARCAEGQVVRHFRVVGWFMSGGQHLEVDVLGTWAGTRSMKPSLLLSFPSGAGITLPI